MKLSDIGEFGFIKDNALNCRGEGVVAGVGDDCAVLRYNDSEYILLASDMVIEGIHFNIDDVPPFYVGYKAVARNISDVAAMGGYPEYILVSIALPPNTEYENVCEIYKGIRSCCKKYSVSIIGGDTASSDKIYINVSIFGKVGKDSLVLRSGAVLGELIFVTGELGGSILKKHYSFEPRLEESGFLASSFKPGAMIDVSDGLAADLSHITDMSGAGALIYAGDIPVSRDAALLSAESGRLPLEHALYDGEDFELLFTLSSSKIDKLMSEWGNLFDLKLSCIGRVVEDKGVYLVRDGKKERIERGGYSHF